MNTKLYHLFFLKKTKKQPSEFFAIYLRITVNGKRAELSTGKSVERKSWMAGTGRAKGSSRTAICLNNELNLVESRLLESYHAMMRRNETKELRALMKKDFSIARLTRVRDIFLFCCFTGLAYVDVRKIGPQNVFTDRDGRPWISVDRTKTSAPSNVPLLPAALRIVEKYQEHPYCKSKNRLLPVVGNQRMNSYLKEIG